MSWDHKILVLIAFPPQKVIWAETTKYWLELPSPHRKSSKTRKSSELRPQNIGCNCLPPTESHLRPESHKILGVPFSSQFCKHFTHLTAWQRSSSTQIWTTLVEDNQTRICLSFVLKEFKRHILIRPTWTSLSILNIFLDREKYSTATCLSLSPSYAGTT